MISFMVISGERSGSTWAANWLTTDTTLCIHDPLMRYALDDLDGILPLGPWRKGIACTALQLVPRWVNAHPAKKVIVHRSDAEIMDSWTKLGVNASGSVKGTNERLWKIDGFHIGFKDLFNPESARYIAEHLAVPFDAHRHAELVQMNIQVQWAAASISQRPIQDLVDRIERVLGK